MSNETNEFKAMMGMFHVCGLMLDARDEMPVSMMKTFLGVAIWGSRDGRKDQLTMMELADKIGLPSTTVSRHLRYLGDEERPGKAGADLVRSALNPLDRRQRLVFLSPKGVALMNNVKKAMGV